MFVNLNNMHKEIFTEKINGKAVFQIAVSEYASIPWNDLGHVLLRFLFFKFYFSL